MHGRTLNTRTWGAWMLLLVLPLLTGCNSAQRYVSARALTTIVLDDDEATLEKAEQIASLGADILHIATTGLSATDLARWAAALIAGEMEDDPISVALWQDLVEIGLGTPPAELPRDPPAEEADAWLAWIADIARGMRDGANRYIELKFPNAEILVTLFQPPASTQGPAHFRGPAPPAAGAYATAGTTTPGVIHLGAGDPLGREVFASYLASATRRHAVQAELAAWRRTE